MCELQDQWATHSCVEDILKIYLLLFQVLLLSHVCILYNVVINRKYVALELNK
jgi:hypothetical protein